MVSATNTRRLSSVRYTRPFVFRYAGLWVLLCVSLILFAGVTSYLLFSSHWSGLMDHNPELAAQQAESRARFLLILTLETVLLLGAVFGLAMMTTHRLAGPVVGLRMACEDVAKGDLSRRVAFRRHNDELDQLADAFNAMMDTVEKRVRSAEGGTTA